MKGSKRWACGVRVTFAGIITRIKLGIENPDRLLHEQSVAKCFKQLLAHTDSLCTVHMHEQEEERNS